jgi:cell division protein FtsQ
MWDRPETLNRLADLLLLVAAGLALYVALHHIARLPVFALREARLTAPVKHVTEAELTHVVRRDLQGNFFTLDLAHARAALEKLPWVRSASIRRRWPDALDIALEERVPLARWAESGLVRTDRALFEGNYDGPLPLFAGPPGAAKEMAIQYEYFRASLAAVDRVPVRIHVSPRRAWRLELDGGTIIELGREHMEARLSRFVAVYPRTLAPFKRPISYVDLRYANGFAVRIPEHRPEAPAQRATGRS